MRLIFLALSCLFLPATALAQGTWEERTIERMAWPELQTFENDREYREWLRDLDRMRRRFRNRRAEAGQGPEILVGAVKTRQQECNPLLELCERADDERIVLTGSRVIPSPAPSITNNQSSDVDEGDIVKRIGDYLLVLQDGRIFVANFRTMARTDRIDVYRRDENGDSIGADWYDEMLVQGDHVLIIAYSYTEEASEISVFRLDQETGEIERRGVFLISSEDYYDVDNYATRVVSDRLVIYTPYEPRDLADRSGRPVVRRWVADQNFDDRSSGGSPILAARDIYRPVFGTFDPVVHTISICDLGELDRDDLECESTAFIGADHAEMYVSPDNIYLATTAASYRDQSAWRVCRAVRQGWQQPGAAPGAVFRVPLGRGSPDLLPIRGLPSNQFAMDERDGRFRAMLITPQRNCDDDSWSGREAESILELTDQPLGAFRNRYREVSDNRLTQLPAIASWDYENRFIGDWLIYGTRSHYGQPPNHDFDETYQPGYATAVHMDDADNPSQVDLGHEVTRIESLGTDAIVTGYRDTQGLFISYLDLGETAQIADRAFLKDHYESESRSHAFNAMTYEDGNGLLGIPTVRAEEDAGREPWHSEDSGISFLRFDAAGQMGELGRIAPNIGEVVWDEEGDGEWMEYPNGYRCEVSCIDWYGNARPIFIERSVFALMGTEIVEGQVGHDSISVSRRLDLTGEPSQ